MATSKEVWRNVARGIRYREHPTRKHGKRPDRYYCFIYKKNGKTIQEAVGWASDGITQDKCEKLLIALRENWRTGTGPQSLAAMREDARQKQEAAQSAGMPPVTVHKYFEEHFKPYSLRTKKAISAEKEFSLYRHWIQPIVGELPLINLDFSHWDTILAKMDKAQLAPRTKEYVTGTLRRILRHAQDRGLEIKIPSARQLGAVGPKDNRRLRVLTSSESADILSALEKRNIEAWRVTKFAMLTGCRASEAFKLRWRDVDFTQRQLCFKDTKNKDDRVIFFSAALEHFLQSFGPGEPDSVAFPRSDGQPHAEAPFAFKAVIKELKLNEGRGARDRISFHSIRHTVATQLARVLDVRSLMDVLGWRQVSMAARYIHSNEETKRAALQILDRGINGE